MNGYLEIFAICGGIIFAIAYVLVSNGKLAGPGVPYNVMMLCGTSIYLIYSILIKAPSIAFLNIFFMSVSIRALYKCWRRKKLKMVWENPKQK